MPHEDDIDNAEQDSEDRTDRRTFKELRRVRKELRRQRIAMKRQRTAQRPPMRYLFWGSC